MNKLYKLTWSTRVGAEYTAIVIAAHESMAKQLAGGSVKYAEVEVEEIEFKEGLVFKHKVENLRDYDDADFND